MHGGEATLTGVAVLFNDAGTVGERDGYVFGPGTGGGIKTVGDGIATLERTWLLWNNADSHAQCDGNIQLRDWNVIGDPGRFHSGPPCD